MVYGENCIEFESKSESTLNSPRPPDCVTTEDHIRDLCARLINAGDDEDVAALSEQLRDALREHTQNVRSKLIRASSIPQHPEPPPNPNKAA
jgi:hypothetical protein